MPPISRRDFVKGAALVAALDLPKSVRAAASERPAAASSAPTIKGGPPRLHWIDGVVPETHAGTAWGMAWPRGAHAPDTSFSLRSPDGRNIALQSWPSAYWPDGSLKWTGHAIPGDAARLPDLVLEPGATAAPDKAVRVEDNSDGVTVANDLVRLVVAKSGRSVITSLSRGDRETLTDGHLVAMTRSSPTTDASGTIEVQDFVSQVLQTDVEQDGPVRAVVKVSGIHRATTGRTWLPFTIRLYLHAASEAVRIAHTFVFDGDEQHDFIKALGFRFSVPMCDALHDRHVRFLGDDHGQWAEAVRGITGLRRDPGAAIRQAQIDGRPTPPLETWDRRVSGRLELIPAWGDFSLSQLSANGFTLRKRTRDGFGWIDVDQGKRASGTGYVGGISGGIAFGMRDFWQLHPTQLDVRDAASDAAEVTLWTWSPEAPAMDIRFYHDEMGMDTYAKQLEGLEITYEDYEPGFGTPHGIAHTNEFVLHAVESTPSRNRLDAVGRSIQRAPLLAARPDDYLKTKVFGGLWSLVDRSTPEKAAIEDYLDWTFDFYAKQVDQRHWYGFWNFGDVMHTYDRDRHVWRYDVGGFAWDNSELSPDLWLWYSYLRSGRGEIFRFAEAMSRHNRDVDIYHLGRFAGLGSRHNVQHWGCSAKQLRISTAAYRRFHYYLTTDERTGDVLEEVVNADRRLADVDPVRKVFGARPEGFPARISVGTDWGSAAANWLTAWERTGEQRYLDWLRNAMRAIGGAPHGFFTSSFGYDPETKTITPIDSGRISVSHLSAVFGLVEICAELIDLIDVPDYKRAWIQYCTLYNAPAELQVSILGEALRGNGLRVGHSRLTAYAAHCENDEELARRAWSEYRSRQYGIAPSLETETITGPQTLNPVDEAPWVSTNDVAQRGLASIQNLALAPSGLEP